MRKARPYGYIYQIATMPRGVPPNVRGVVSGAAVGIVDAILLSVLNQIKYYSIIGAINSKGYN